MFARRTDLPLDRDANSRYLPWLIAFMVYLAVLALAGMLSLESLAGRWNRGVTGTLTVQYLPAATPAEDAARRETVLGILRQTPGVARVEPIDNADVAALLEPWLGAGSLVEDLPLPRLVDVELEHGAHVDADVLTTRLLAAADGAAVDDHRVWLSRLIRLVDAIEILATAVLALIGLVTVATVVFTTRTGLAIHREVIEVLHMIGAQDAYIARQFAGRAMGLGLRGGLVGLAFALPTLGALQGLASTLEDGLLPAMSLRWEHWLAVGGLPLVAAGVAMLTARMTVMRTLARMP